jgi:hypothetical protein
MRQRLYFSVSSNPLEASSIKTHHEKENIVMKWITAVALLTIASIVSAGRALAQDRAVQATVPFDFTVGDKLLPSGTYTITSVSSGVILIQNYDKHVTALSTFF